MRRVFVIAFVLSLAAFAAALNAIGRAIVNAEARRERDLAEADG